MRTFKNIFLLSIVITLCLYIKTSSEKSDEEKKVKSAFKDDFNDCIYSPFNKINSPYFIGAIGYLIPNNLDNEKDFNFPWKIRTYKQIGPEYYEEAKIKLQERVRVKVIQEHIIKRTTLNSFLTVQLLDTLQNKTFIIRADGFSEIPYWNCDLGAAIRQAPILAKLKSGVEPPTFNGEWLKLSERAIIICTNVSGFNNELINAYVYDPAIKKYYYSSVTFKKETLTALKY